MTSSRFQRGWPTRILGADHPLRFIGVEPRQPATNPLQGQHSRLPLHPINENFVAFYNQKKIKFNFSNGKMYGDIGGQGCSIQY